MYSGARRLKLARWKPFTRIGSQRTLGSAEMPHLHLPMDHTDADLVLAANLADIVGSEELFVAWTQDSGAGVPEIQAVVSEERPAGPFAELLASLAAGCVAFWRALTGQPPQRELRDGATEGDAAPREIEPSA
jgi:hypothetical protein